MPATTNQSGGLAPAGARPALRPPLWLEREAAETGGPLRRGGDAPGADSLAEISGQRPPELSGDLPLRTVRVNPLAAVVPNGYRPLTAYPPRSIVNSPDLDCRSNVDERLFGLDHSSIPRLIMAATPRPPLVFFLHLPRTAGTTLARVIERQYTSEAILPLYDSSTGEELGRVPPARLDSLRAVVGHFYFGAHRFLGRPSTYVTVLRDPVDRVISHYYFVRGYPTHYLHETARRMSLSEYVISCDLAEPNNDQTRLLCGEYQGSVPDRCTHEMLPVAKKNLREHCAVVGLTEDFDRSLIVMKRVLGWSTPFYVRQNVSPQRLRRNDLSDETLRVIRAYNQLDLELYRHAEALLQEQVSCQGDSFESEVRAFKRLNALVGRGRSLMSSAIGHLRGRA